MKAGKMRNKWLAILLMAGMVLTSQPITTLAGTIVGIVNSEKRTGAEQSGAVPGENKQPDGHTTENGAETAEIESEEESEPEITAAELESRSDAESEPAERIEPGPDAESEPAAEMEIGPDAESEPAAEMEAGPDAESEPAAETESESESVLEAIAAEKSLEIPDPFTYSDGAVRMTVFLSEDFILPEGAHLTAQRMEDESQKGSVSAYVGKSTALELYDIYFEDDAGERVAVDGPVTLKAEYLNGGLAGDTAERQLMVLRLDGGAITQEDEQQIDNIEKTDTAITGFRFKTESLDHPFAFAVKKVFGGYVSNLHLEVSDGTGVLDADDALGNDSSYKNGRVRTFDTVKYDLMATFGSRSTGRNFHEAQIHFEMLLNVGPTKAKFDTSAMLWMESGTIEYLDSAGRIVSSAEIGRGVGSSWNTDPNVNGSDKGTESYNHAGIAQQRIRGIYKLADNRESVIPGSKALTASVKILAARNGDQLQPAIRVWLEGNEENFGAESTEQGGNKIPGRERRNELGAKDTGTVTVTAAPRYNVRIRRTSQLQELGTFDLKTGEKATESSEEKNLAYGRLHGFGIVLQLYNTGSGAAATAQAKGLMGIELPQGEIAFDITLSETFGKGGAFDQITQGEIDSKFENWAEEKDFIPILWDYGEAMSGAADGRGHGYLGRNMALGNGYSIEFACGTTPYNKGSAFNTCYNGGTWTITNAAKSETRPTSTDAAARTFHVKVSGYDFDLDNYRFPTNDTDKVETNIQEGYDSYIGCFSAGCIEVLMQRPTSQPGTYNHYMKVEVSNLKASTVSGQTVRDADGSRNGAESFYGDNAVNEEVTLHAPGSMFKQNSFTRLNGTGISSQFLNDTGFFVRNSDAAAYAGNMIAMWGAIYLSPVSDGNLEAFDLFQKFDSAALEIVGTPEYCKDSSHPNMGTGRIFYVADTQYPKGYDANSPEALADPLGYRMNTVTMDDPELLFYDSTETLEQDGYTCVGVLLEVRDAELRGGRYINLKIPVTVRNEAVLVGRTTCTINEARAWKKDSAILAPIESKGDAQAAENPRKADFLMQNRSAAGYAKSEYDEGQVRAGTHLGGSQYGMSLLIQGYSAKVGIEVKNLYTGIESTTDRRSVAFDMDKSQRTAVFRITNLGTKIEGTSQNTQLELTTELDVPVEMPEGLKVQANSYTIAGRLISGDKDHPTEYSLSYNGNTHVVKIYADRATDGRKVTFHLLGMPVGASIPAKDAIELTAEIGNAGKPGDVKNNAVLTATVGVSGRGDRRAYSAKNGNFSSVSVGIIKLSETAISKAVDRAWTELDDEFVYTISYRNNSKNAIEAMYLYDLLPYSEDARKSGFHGDFKVTGVDVKLKAMEGKDGSETDSEISLYKSAEIDRTVLNQKLAGFEDGQVPDGFELIRKETVSFHGELRTADNRLDGMTCLYVKAAPVGGANMVEIRIHMKPLGNKAADLYHNTANVYTEETKALVSNQVETQVLSRNISGVVWYDRDKDGLCNDGQDSLLSGVTATLFQWNDNEKKYEICRSGYRTADAITPVTTGVDGAYAFRDLASGDYLVAFSGDALDDYLGATKYQAGGSSDTGSDGVALSAAWPGVSSEYRYVIRYAADSSGGNNIALHSIEQIQSQNIRLDNCVENLVHQDLGLIREGNLEISKKVTNPQSGKDQSEFLFKVKLTGEKDGETVPVSGIFGYVGGTLPGITDATAPADGNVKFDETGEAVVALKHGQTITIQTLPADAKYTVTETEIPGYKAQSWHAAGVIPNENTAKARFINTYSAAGSIALSGLKTTDKIRWEDLTDKAFSFELEEAILDEDGVLTYRKASDGWNEQDNPTARTTKNPVVADEDGTFSLSLHFTMEDLTDRKDGTVTGYLDTKDFTFLLKELDRDGFVNREGISYRFVYTVSNAEKDGVLDVRLKEVSRILPGEDGKAAETDLTAEVEAGAELAEFTNTYLAEGNAQLSLKKVLTGSRRKPIGEGEFCFSARELLEAPVEKVVPVQKYRRNGDGDIIAYHGETVPSGESDSDGLGDGESGNDGSYKTTAAITIPYTQEVLKLRDGADDFGRVFWYELTEDDVELPVTGDETVYYAKVTVSLDLEDQELNENKVHKMNAPAVYYKYNEDGVLTELGSEDDVIFTNHYNANGSLTLEAEKILENSPLPEGLFSFALTQVSAEDTNIVTEGGMESPEEDKPNTVAGRDTANLGTDKLTVGTEKSTGNSGGNEPDPASGSKLLQTKTNNADGKVVFDTLVYDEKDIGKTYTYTVAEENKAVAGILYDETAYTVTVHIEDGADSDGSLEITKTITGPLAKNEEAKGKGANSEEGNNEEGNGEEGNGEEGNGEERNGEEGNGEEGNGEEVNSEEGNDDETGEKTDEGAAATVSDMVFKNIFAGSVTLTKIGMSGTGRDQEALSGAAFQLFCQTATVEGDTAWTPYNNASYVTDIDGTLTVSGLPAGNYYFVETQAPTGYAIAADENGEPVQYPFTIGLGDEEGQSFANTELTFANAELTVTNVPEDDDTTLVVTKQLVYEDELWNAADETFYVALYSDEALTNRVSDIRPMEFRNSNTSSVVFTDLEYDRTYYVGETTDEGVTLNPMGGVTAGGQAFRAEFRDGNAATITRGEGTQIVCFRNVFEEIPLEYYREGNLTVTKRLLDADGAEKPADRTFYAGIFSDAEYTQLSDDVSQNIVTLSLNGASAATSTVKVTVPAGRTVTVYVTETDKNGRPVAGSESFRYDVTVEGTTVMMDGENLNGTVVITNQERREETYETELLENDEKGNGEEESDSIVPALTNSVKTGDDTPIGVYVGLFLSAALLLILVFVLKKHK